MTKLAQFTISKGAPTAAEYLKGLSEALAKAKAPKPKKVKDPVKLIRALVGRPPSGHGSAAFVAGD